MINNNYELNLTFRTLLQEFKEKSFFRVYPEVNLEIDMLKELINESSTYNDVETFFGIPIETGYSNDYYHLNWNISKVEDYIKNNIDLKVDFPTDTKIIWSDPTHLDLNKLENFKTIKKIDKPIVFAFHPVFNILIVIDGNHRFHTALFKKEKTISAIVLMPETHLGLMVNERSRMLFIVHYNLMFLKKFCTLPFITNYNIDCKFDGNNYYPLTDNKLNFEDWKRFKLLFFQFLTLN